jgi:hypothetical protein
MQGRARLLLQTGRYGAIDSGIEYVDFTSSPLIHLALKVNEIIAAQRKDDTG